MTADDLRPGERVVDLFANRDREPFVMPDDDQERERFALLTPGALAATPPPMRWLVRGVWPEKSHGPLAGEKKTLKTYNALAGAVAIATGKPMLGAFDVVTPGPVLFFVGEGGQAPFQRRLHRICAAYGAAPVDVPLYAVVDAGPFDSPEFKRALSEHLDEVQPVLVVLDPLYAYHPANVEAGNLYERGRLLAGLSRQVGHDAALWIPDHFNKTGNKSVSHVGSGDDR